MRLKVTSQLGEADSGKPPATDFLCRWLNYFLFRTPVDHFPEDLVLQNGKPVFEAIEFLSGRNPEKKVGQRAQFLTVVILARFSLFSFTNQRYHFVRPPRKVVTMRARKIHVLLRDTREMRRHRLYNEGVQYVAYHIKNVSFITLSMLYPFSLRTF